MGRDNEEDFDPQPYQDAEVQDDSDVENDGEVGLES